MKLVTTLLIGVVLVSAGTIHPQLGEILNKMDRNDELQVIVHMKNQPDLIQLPDGTPKVEKLLYLQAYAEHDQKPILELLRSYGSQVSNLQTYWIFNGFTFKARKEVIETIAASDVVDYVIDDFVIKLHTEKSYEIETDRTPEWNITMVSAPLCWNDGYDGAGIIVGNMDTGVDVDHPAFGGRWIPGGWFDGVNGQPDPYDDHGHGTHTMGTICGGDGNGSFADDVGVAPGATFICAKAFDSGGSGQATWIHACFQWFATQTAQVVSNSWGNNNQTTLEFWDDCLNWRSLGIYPAFSIGNNGTAGPGSAGTPGNFPIVTGVGATDNADNIASFSSRGPAPNQTPWTDTTYWARPDWNLIKPDISAPGVAVRSAAPGGGYQSMQGTSMACPHVAGAVAICLQKNQTLDFETLHNILLDYADEPPQGSPYPNNDYGWGRLNVYAALQAVPPPEPHHNIRARMFDVPQPIIEEFITIQPSVRFRNTGTFDETNIPVQCLIKIGNTTVYTSNRTISNLPQNTESLVVFDNFVVGQMGTHYAGYGISSLANDTFYNDDTTTLNFVAARKLEAVSPGCLAWKYPNADSGSVPIPSHSGWIPATTAELQQIAANDNDRWVTAGATDTAHQDLQLYGFNLNVPDSMIEQITVEWWGQHGATIHNRCALYFWNDQSGSWSRRADATNVTDDVLLSSTLHIDSAAQYVNTSSFFYASTGADVYISSCCPLLFAWDGEKNTFIGDIIAGGDIGTWVGNVMGTNLYLPPDYDEYVKIDGERVACVDGKYRFTVNEMLQEVTYLDEAKLYVVDHPENYDIYPHEALFWPGYEGFSIHTSAEQPIVSAYNDHGHDILHTLQDIDRVYVPFEKAEVSGFAKPYAITLDLGDLDKRAVLYLHGSCRFPDAGDIEPVSDVYQASRNGMKVQPPKVEIIGRNGHWQEIPTCGMPAGYKKTVTYRLYDDNGSSLFKTQDHRMRITIYHEVYLDKAWLGYDNADTYRVVQLQPSEADLHYYGYAAYHSPDGKYPGDFDYSTRIHRNYAQVAGYYTKYGDIVPLLQQADNQYAIMSHGDEIALEYDAGELPEVPDGWQRDFIFAAKGFYKMARPGRAYAYSVEPLPFVGMRDDLSASGVGYYPYDPSPNLIASLVGRLYAKVTWDYPFSLREAWTMISSHMTGKAKRTYPADLIAYREQWNTRHVRTYFPEFYADLPPHVNLEGVPLKDTDGDWTTCLVTAGIPFGDHSLHSNYVRLWLITTGPTAITEEKSVTPSQFSFSIGYPNPFRTSTRIHYAIPTPSEVRLAVYDGSGRLVRTLFKGMQKSGAHDIIWDGTDNLNRKLAAGVYFVQFETSDYTETKKTVLLK